jgi:hypothetical protein
MSPERVVLKPAAPAASVRDAAELEAPPDTLRADIATRSGNRRSVCPEG